MQYRLDPKSGNQLSVLGLGCMRLPNTLGRIDSEKAAGIFDQALEMGINYFDTAYLYPGSENVLGSYFSKRNNRDKLYLATKLPQALCKKPADFERFFTEQKRRLQTNYIDYYLIHNISEFEQWERLCGMGIEDWIKAKKKSGEIKQIGFSFHGSNHDFMRLLDVFSWDFCQIQYNYMNIHYQAGVTGLKKAAQMGLPVIIMEPLLGGRLATGLPKKAATLFHKVNPALSPAQWALKWLWNQPEVTVVLSGMNQTGQLQENTETASDTEPDTFKKEEADTIEQVIEIFNESYKVPCTGCNYCMPCPQQINIPAVFSAYNTSYSINKGTGVKLYMLSCGIMSETPHFAGSCIKCGKCESHCPQHIPIREALADSSKRLESFWYKQGIKLVRRFYR